MSTSRTSRHILPVGAQPRKNIRGLRHAAPLLPRRSALLSPDLVRGRS